MENKYNDEAIAVISMTGRFPGAKNVSQFWENLKNGVESVSTFSEEELVLEDESGTAQDKKKYVNADGVLDDIDKFDAQFFELSPREAEIMDPQHRLFIEAAWEAMEMAGYMSEKYDGTIAVYAGANLSSYMIRNLYSNPGLVEKIGTFKTMLTNGQDFLATRVSYLMDLKGPSVNVNTLCSSSLVAVHSACQSLIDFHCDVAIAGGVNIQVSKNEALFYQEGGIGASDGHCRAFDAKANGTVSGSGLGVVVLKRLEDAINDGDTIHGIIRGTAINNDGASKNSYTAPNPDGQAECIADAIAMSEVDPDTITLIEAHGTGTNLGDPIEIAGLTKAFRSQSESEKTGYCAIGSVKTNIGHLVTAGGVASLIKVLLSMKHSQIPASLNFDEPNPKIDFDKTPFFVNTQLTDWKPEGDVPKRAGISSFGIGGTNAHVVVEESFTPQASGESRGIHILSLSAKTKSALENMKNNILSFIKENPETNPADLAYTLHVGRRDFDNRLCVVYTDLADLEKKVSSGDGVVTGREKLQSRKVVFLIPHVTADPAFENQSSLYEKDEVFRTHFDECVAAFPADAPKMSTRAFASSYAFGKLWMEWGAEPESIMANGSGLIVAACLTGGVTLEEGAKAFLADTTVDTEAGDIPVSAFNAQEVLGNTAPVYIEIGNPSWSTRDLMNAGEELCVVSGFSGADEAALENQLNALGRYWVHKGSLDWNTFYQQENRRRITLPTYPFERKRYWIEPGSGIGGTTGQANGESFELKRQPRPNLDTPFAGATTETEKILVAKWEEVLGIEKVGIHDDFYDLGGHSLLAASIASSLSETFGITLDLTELMEHSTVAALSELIDTYTWAANNQPKEETGKAAEVFEEGVI